ncbi:unnamed protein product [Anisakis simplex]|uniref:Peptidase_S8 domain-containing protein n=1 Tax=Anisakis simplex TaxID=6269 RepID=A0A0M3K282_ANISI|nr:unnamed protein product [Anisakis simplex]
MIASHLRLLGNVSTIRISVASVGAVYEADSALLQPFYDNYTHVNDAIIRVAANLPDDEGIPPISVGNMLTKEYCESTDPEYKLNPQTPTTFIIFSGWPGDIPNPVSDPWFSCSTAPNKKVFMVGIEESTEKLDLLGVPSTEFYRKMTEFTWEAMEQLAAVIDSKICGDPQPAAAGSDERLFRSSGSHGDIPIRKDYDEAPLKCTHPCYEEP